jgi:haloacetate dehalogenase
MAPILPTTFCQPSLKFRNVVSAASLQDGDHSTQLRLFACLLMLWGDPMFEGFALEMIALPEATLRVRHGGSGPPVLLLHGHPRTHTTWFRAAPLLATSHTVVCPDLRGFGRSSKPADTTDHSGSSKRAKARDCVALMKHLGFERFAIVGHDRGSYTAFRTAMDHPLVVSHLAVLDGVPIIEALDRCTARFAQAWWHWFFFGQPEKPERAILADPDAWYGGSPDTMGEDNFADYRAAIRDPETVHGMIEDYRAGLGIDRDHDEEDRRHGRTLQCPVLCLWSLRDDLEHLYGDVLGVWQGWAPDLRGHGIDAGHHMAEEAPEALVDALKSFLEN